MEEAKGFFLSGEELEKIKRYHYELGLQAAVDPSVYRVHERAYTWGYRDALKEPRDPGAPVGDDWDPR